MFEMDMNVLLTNCHFRDDLFDPINIVHFDMNFCYWVEKNWTGDGSNDSCRHRWYKIVKHYYLKCIRSIGKWCSLREGALIALFKKPHTEIETFWKWQCMILIKNDMIECNNLIMINCMNPIHKIESVRQLMVSSRVLNVICFVIQYQIIWNVSVLLYVVYTNLGSIFGLHTKTACLPHNQIDFYIWCVLYIYIYIHSIFSNW